MKEEQRRTTSGATNEDARSPGVDVSRLELHIERVPIDDRPLTRARQDAPRSESGRSTPISNSALAWKTGPGTWM